MLHSDSFNLLNSNISFAKKKKIIHSLDSSRNTIFITDSNVFTLYKKLLSDYEVIIIPPGEQYKTFETAVVIYEDLLDFGLDRHSQIVALGGGIVCDIAGFVASTFLRGIKISFIPTTLLAMVDASIGGKNGLNLGGFKNIIGTFSAPENIFIDTDFLQTLPCEEISNGLAELTKSALVWDEKLFEYLEKNSQEILNLEKKQMNHVVWEAVKIKSEIVRQDEKEKNLRKILNFGHTLAHGIEKINQLPHGKSVSVGMRYALEISVHFGLIQAETKDRILGLLTKFGLPISIKITDNLLSAISKDKKRDSGSIDFILLSKIGEAEIKNIKMSELKQLFTYF
jgi:3-dehydroquinate synthase